MQQKTQQTLDLGRDATGEARSAPSQGTEASTARASLERPAAAGPSMEAVVERENLKKALAQVKCNKGAAGADGMTVGELPAYLNNAKSAVAKPSVRKFLGFSFTSEPLPRRRIAPQAIVRFKARVRELTRRTGGKSLA